MSDYCSFMKHSYTGKGYSGYFGGLKLVKSYKAKFRLTLWVCSWQILVLNYRSDLDPDWISGVNMKLIIFNYLKG